MFYRKLLLLLVHLRLHPDFRNSDKLTVRCLLSWKALYINGAVNTNLEVNFDM